MKVRPVLGMLSVCVAACAAGVGRAVFVVAGGGVQVGRRLSLSGARSVVAVLASFGVLVGVPALVAVPASADSCPNAVFRSGPSSRLPDCRAYEMVTPTYKEGFPANPFGFAEGGSAMWAQSIGAFAGSEQDLYEFGLGGGLLLEGGSYIMSRGASGWSTTAITPSGVLYPDTVPVAFNQDFSVSMWVGLSTAQQQLAEAMHVTRSEEASFYVHSGGGSLVEVGRLLPEAAVGLVNGQAGDFWTFAGAAKDLSAVLYEMSEAHWPGDETEPGDPSLYEYVGTGNRAPLLVGVSGGEGSSSLVSRCGTEVSSARGLTHGVAVDAKDQAVSETGGTVYFTALPCSPGPVVRELYARVGNGQPGAHTVAVSEPSIEDCAACDTEEAVRRSASAVGFSKDGSKEFFTTTQPLLGGDESRNLYEYDFDAQAGHRIVRVSGGDGTVENPTAGVESVIGVSPDGSHVYFAAAGVLTRTPNSLGQVAEAGRSNLYLFERDAQYPEGRTVFVMPDADLSGHSKAYPGGVAGFSQSGRFMVFTSSAHLTADDLSEVEQGFEYDSQTGVFVRFSIGEDGFNSDGNTGTVGKAMVANDGSVYFETKNPLVPQAVNGGYNVYEYREGTVSLISSGLDTRSEEPGLLSYISPSGSDVFFTTYEQLVPRDTDSQVDVYDARAGGGFFEPSPSPPCQADACQGSLVGAPVLLSPGSEFQAGGENPASSALPEESAATVKSKPKAKKGTRKRQRRGGKRKRARRASHGASAGGKGGRR